MTKTINLRSSTAQSTKLIYLKTLNLIIVVVPPSLGQIWPKGPKNAIYQASTLVEQGMFPLSMINHRMLFYNKEFEYLINTFIIWN